jgi:hypothetical protein
VKITRTRQNRGNIAVSGEAGIRRDLLCRLLRYNRCAGLVKTAGGEAPSLMPAFRQGSIFSARQNGFFARAR